jgi:hypothetical protein
LRMPASLCFQYFASLIFALNSTDKIPCIDRSRDVGNIESMVAFLL